MLCDRAAEMISPYGRQRVLHNQRGLFIKRLLLFEERVILASVPYRVPTGPLAAPSIPGKAWHSCTERATGIRAGRDDTETTACRWRRAAPATGRPAGASHLDRGDLGGSSRGSPARSRCSR